jgi:hypothetical protein
VKEAPSPGMAMQSSLGASKVIILLGAGLAGSVLVGNSRISDILSDLSKVRVLSVAAKRG